MARLPSAQQAVDNIIRKYGLEASNIAIAAAARSLIVDNDDNPLIVADPNKSNVALYSFQEGLAATAGGNQATGVKINGAIVRFTTVATAGDAGTLPQASPGMELTVINAGGASLNVFPFLGDKINALSPNAAFAIAAGKVVTFYCTAPLVWHTILSA